MTLIHATCVSVAGAGVLLRGPSGAGKSDLALRLIDGGALLVADDQVDMRPGPAGPVAHAVPSLAGLLEVRGVGILPVPATETAPLVLVVDLTGPVERLPEPQTADVLGCPITRIAIDPFQASAPAKVRIAAATAVARRPFVPRSPECPAHG